MKKNTHSASIHAPSPHHPIPFKSIAAALLALGIATPALAADKTWFGGDGDWGADANWSPAGAPGANDDAIIGAGTSTLSGAAIVQSLSLNGGMLTGTGTLTSGWIDSAASTWSGGQQSGTGTTRFNGPLNISGDDPKLIAGGRVINIGYNTTWGGNTAVNNNAILNNGGGGTINTTTITSNWSDTNAFDTYIGAGITFNNNGFYWKNGNSVTTFRSVFNSTGTVIVSAGTLQVTSPFTNSGFISVSSGAIFQGTSPMFTNGMGAFVAGAGGTIATGAQGLSNSGVIHPYGSLTIDGDLKQTSTGILEFGLSLSSFDLLTVTDDVALDGEIRVEIGIGYTPVMGDTFRIMTFDDRAGTTFSSLSVGGDIGEDSGVTFNVIYNPHDVTLQVATVPEAETLGDDAGRAGLGGFCCAAS